LVDGIKESIVTFLKELSWKDILKGAGEFFGNIGIRYSYCDYWGVFDQKKG